MLPFAALISRESCLPPVHSACCYPEQNFSEGSQAAQGCAEDSSLNKLCSSIGGMLLTGEIWRTGEDTCVSVTLSQVKRLPTDIIKTNESRPLVFSALFPKYTGFEA